MGRLNRLPYHSPFFTLHPSLALGLVSMQYRGLVECLRLNKSYES